MNYVDAHLHLADSGYSGLIEEVLDDAAKNGVNYLLSNGMDYDSSVRTLALADQYKNRVLAAVGLHPWTATNTEGKLSLDIFEKLVEENRNMITAIGEIGLDGQYSQDEAKKLRQREVFQFFLRLAERCKLPVIVHSRLAIDEVLNMLPSFTLPKVVLHWYSGPAEYLQQITDQRYFITIGPNILYAKRTVEIARHADLTTILTETDGPVSYFGPFKGKPTRPAFVIDVVKKIAEIKNQTIDEIRNGVWDNFQSLTTQRQ